MMHEEDMYEEDNKVIAIIFFASSASNLEDYLKEKRRLKKAIKEDKALNMKTA